MRDYAREALVFTADATRADLDTNNLLHHALSYAVGIIGEAASHLSDDFRTAHPDVPWRKIIGMRNFLFHDYIGVSSSILWDTAVLEIPALLAQLEVLLSSET